MLAATEYSVNVPDGTAALEQLDDVNPIETENTDTLDSAKLNTDSDSPYHYQMQARG